MGRTLPDIVRSLVRLVLVLVGSSTGLHTRGLRAWIPRHQKQGQLERLGNDGTNGA